MVEIDTEATAAYVRFGNGPIAKTEPYANRDGLVMVDFDSKGRVLGIEVVGQMEFGISKLLRHVPVNVPREILDRARYVSAAMAA